MVVPHRMPPSCLRSQVTSLRCRRYGGVMLGDGEFDKLVLNDGIEVWVTLMGPT